MPYWLWIPNPDEVVEEFFGDEGAILGGGGKDMCGNLDILFEFVK